MPYSGSSDGHTGCPRKILDFLVNKPRGACAVAVTATVGRASATTRHYETGVCLSSSSATRNPTEKCVLPFPEPSLPLLKASQRSVVAPLCNGLPLSTCFQFMCHNRAELTREDTESRKEEADEATVREGNALEPLCLTQPLPQGTERSAWAMPAGTRALRGCMPTHQYMFLRFVVPSVEWRLCGGSANSESATDGVCRESCDARCSKGTWPAARFGHTAVYADGVMTVFGGKACNGYLSDIQQYDVARRRWTAHTRPHPSERRDGRPIAWPPGRSAHASVLHRGLMYVISGVVSDSGEYADDFWSYSLRRREWEREDCGLPLPFAPRKGHTAHVLPRESTGGRAPTDMIVVFGGLACVDRLRPRLGDPVLPPLRPGDPTCVAVPSNTVFLYKPPRRQWCQLRTCGEAPAPRFFHVSEIVSGTNLLLVFGGRTLRTLPGSSSSSSEILGDLHVADLATGVWRAVRGCAGDPPIPRSCAASVFCNGLFVVFAGGDGTCCPVVLEFDVPSRRWSQRRVPGAHCCSRPTVTVAGDRLLFFGGCVGAAGVTDRLLEMPLGSRRLVDQSLMSRWYAELQELMNEQTARRGQGPRAAPRCTGADSPRAPSPPPSNCVCTTSFSPLLRGRRTDDPAVSTSFAQRGLGRPPTAQDLRSVCLNLNADVGDVLPDNIFSPADAASQSSSEESSDVAAAIARANRADIGHFILHNCSLDHLRQMTRAAM